MKVQNIECQITQAQLKRYLNGDNLPEDLVSDIERHIQLCPDCLAVAKGEKVAIAEQLSATPGPMEALIRKIRPGGKSADGPEIPLNPQPGNKAVWQNLLKNPKLMAQAGGLVVVLIAMLFFMRDPTKLFGPKAKPAVAAAQTEKAEAEAPAEASEAAVAAASRLGDDDPLAGQTPTKISLSTSAEKTAIAFDAIQGSLSDLPSEAAAPAPAAEQPAPEQPVAAKPAEPTKPAPGELVQTPAKIPTLPASSTAAKPKAPLTPDVSAVVPNLEGQKVVVSEKAPARPVNQPAPRRQTPPRRPVRTANTNRPRTSTERVSAPRRAAPKPVQTSQPASRPNTGTVKIYDPAGKPVK